MGRENKIFFRTGSQIILKLSMEEAHCICSNREYRFLNKFDCQNKNFRLPKSMEWQSKMSNLSLSFAVLANKNALFGNL